MPLLLLIAALAAAPLAASAEGSKVIVLDSGSGATVSIDPDSLEVYRLSSGSEPRLVAPGLSRDAAMATLGGSVRARKTGPGSATLIYPGKALELSVAASGDDIVFRFAASAPLVLGWPSQALSGADGLVWPMADGRFIPTDDSAWMDDLVGEGERDLGQGLPVWGWTDARGTVAWATDTPYRSVLTVSRGASAGTAGSASASRAAVDGQAGRVSQQHSFLCRFGPEDYVVAARLSDRIEPLLPAFLLRDRLAATGRLPTLAAKLPPTARDRLPGALHAYLWGDAMISARDIKQSAFRRLALRISDGSALGARVLSAMDGESRAAVAAFVADEWAGAYAKAQLARGLDAAIAAIGAEAVYAGYRDCLSPPGSWGEGISAAAIRELRALGIDRARLTVPGMPPAGTEARYAEASRAAEASGYLFGVYDSYHSVHPASIWGTDDSWETARFTQELYENGAIMRADGSYYSGFKGRGRLLSPLAAGPYFEERVARNLAALSMSAYFMDCDGAGEIYEDYDPRRPASSEAMAAARRERLARLSAERGLVVGTEGGDASIVTAAHVSEGLFGPAFYWEEPEYKDRSSPYFMGGYWPPSAPAIQFKPMRLKERSMRRYFDPATRVPLFQAALRESVVIANHWGADPLKFAGMENAAELFQALYLSSPLYNLNRDRIASDGKRIAAYYAFASPLEREFTGAKLESFERLSPDGLAQSTSFAGGLRMVANFSGKAFSYRGTIVPAGSVAALLPDGSSRVHTPGAPRP
ncbi:MAG: glycoside hydrolase [Spirochaetes bacterium]|nr:glycoside hydrolase [Spirochaetota bacterium]MBU1081238.1 glycoside hydrolase [Spirochaetota bacterium]